MASRARQLRKNSTPAEQNLWGHLRRKQMKGCKFRRQCPIGPYTVDFVCSQRMLIIELDGEHHNDQAEADAERTGWLSSQGYRTLRFWNHEVLHQTEHVLRHILRSLEAVPQPEEHV